MKRLAVIAVAVMAQGCSNWGHMTQEEIRPENWFGGDEEKVVKRSVDHKPRYPELYDTTRIKEYSKPNVSKPSKPEPTKLDWEYGVAPTYLSNPTIVSAAWYGRFGLMCSRTNDYRKFTFKLDAEQIKRFKLFNPTVKFYGAISLKYDNRVQMRFENPSVDILYNGVYLVVSSRRYDVKPVKEAMNRAVKSSYTTVVLESLDYKKEYRVESYKFLQQKPATWNCKR